MYLIYTRHRVKDYDVWKKAFDDNTHLFSENGITEWHVVQVNGDPTDVAIIVYAPSKEHWEHFIQADEKKREQTGMDPRVTGGLVGNPEWWTGEVL